MVAVRAVVFMLFLRNGHLSMVVNFQDQANEVKDGLSGEYTNKFARCILQVKQIKKNVSRNFK